MKPGLLAFIPVLLIPASIFSFAADAGRVENKPPAVSPDMAMTACPAEPPDFSTLPELKPMVKAETDVPAKMPRPDSKSVLECQSDVMCERRQNRHCH